MNNINVYRIIKIKRSNNDNGEDNKGKLQITGLINKSSPLKNNNGTTEKETTNGKSPAKADQGD